MFIQVEPTLKMGIENTLKHFILEAEEVRPINE